ncbi:MAG: S9 family peptidase [Acidobacteria bacterium]|nr:MAG: S9 family peptidase [Acidobacteriota bacterium]
MKRLALVIVLISLFSPVSAVHATRPFTVHDMVAMERISDAQPSPDGNKVVFTVKSMDLDANRGHTDLWMAATDGSSSRQLTSHSAGDFSARWADDTTLYFLSTRSGSVQVWRLSLEGGEAIQVTDLPLDVESMVIGPDASALYLGLKIFPDCKDSISCTVERLDAKEKQKTTGMVFDSILVRHWDTWKDGRRNHIVAVKLDDKGQATGKPADLMAGMDSDCPTIPWGGDGDYVVTPDGSTLVFTAKNADGAEEAWTTNWDLWAVPTDGSIAPKCLTTANKAWDTAPAFSPDGKTLAYLAMVRPDFEADRYRVMLMDWASGETRTLTENWDRSPGSVTWSPDGSMLYASANNVGNHSIFEINSSTGHVQALVTKGTNSGPHPLADGRLLFSRDSLTAPREVFVRPADGGKALQITHFNDEHLAELEFGEYEQFSFIGAHGDEVWGYLIHPVGFESDKKYPLAFLIHGGPQGSFDDHWHFRWNPQIYAAHGYAMVMIDFHGSTGYGQAFTDAIRGDWGGAPYEDLMKGLDDVLAKNPWIDSDRMAALGASYGGYMINWIQGQTDRFAALVCHDGNLDEYMAYFDTEELWFPEWEHGGTPWENPEGYRKHSPVNHVADFKTPELVIHGALDYRVVDTQGLAMFNALQRMGVPSRLLYYPDENHWVLKPLNSIQWHEVVLEWIDRWTAEGQ